MALFAYIITTLCIGYYTNENRVLWTCVSIACSVCILPFYFAWNDDEFWGSVFVYSSLFWVGSFVLWGCGYMLGLHGMAAFMWVLNVFAVMSSISFAIHDFKHE